MVTPVERRTGLNDGLAHNWHGKVDECCVDSVSAPRRLLATPPRAPTSCGQSPNLHGSISLLARQTHASSMQTFHHSGQRKLVVRWRFLAVVTDC